jgi:hypothetical protein
MMHKKLFIVFLIVAVFGIVTLVYNNSLIRGGVSVNPVTIGVHPAIVSTLSVVDDVSSASAVSAGSKIVTWKTSSYPNNVGVNINLIRKISNAPAAFKLVRILATNTLNDGQELWIPKSGENTNDLYIEVTCSNTYKFTQGCNLSNVPVKVAQ